MSIYKKIKGYIREDIETILAIYAAKIRNNTGIDLSISYKLSLDFPPDFEDDFRERTKEFKEVRYVQYGIEEDLISEN